MKVLHMTKVQGVGGAERHLLTLLPALRARGIDARLLSLDAGGDADRFHDALTERDVPFTTVRCRADLSPWLARDVVAATRNERPDLIHTHMVHADVYGSVAAHALRTPFVSTRHNDDRYLLGPFRYVDRVFMHGALRIIAISDAVRVFHERAGLPRDRLTTVHYGLDDLPHEPSERTPADLGVPDGVPLVLAIGRLIEQKDHATLLDAFARVHAETPEARLAILGWGRLEEQTREHARALGLAGSVLLPGRLEPRAWLERADVFAHTSRWEGFGIVLLEAMLAGIPIVATNVSAIPEIVVEGETGYLVAPGDDAAVAARIASLVSDRERAAAMGRAGRERAQRDFSVARMTDATIAVYDGAAGR
jgi:glycosyltransferase involved in cell wall biosynthesis